MLIKHAPRLRASDITPKSVYMNRRTLMAGAGAAALVASRATAAPLTFAPFEGEAPSPLTDKSDATSYNNFYELGTDKGDPARNARKLTTSPWTVAVDGLVDKPGNYALEDLIPAALEERIYRLRCVEAWSMVIPWIGFELRTVLEKVGVQSSAKYVSFETLVRPEEMPGQRGVFQSIDWPYVEGLRLDEAMHPLTILANGMYGETLPGQNGAPLRLVVPWKYGFKSIKSIVRITLTDFQPQNTWNVLQPSEYGFFANVNPQVDHPRWSQAEERIVGSGLFAKKQETLMFNGYADEVASLYDGMDLRVHI